MSYPIQEIAKSTRYLHYGGYQPPGCVIIIVIIIHFYIFLVSNREKIIKSTNFVSMFIIYFTVFHCSLSFTVGSGKPEAYSEPWKISKKECFAKIVNAFWLLTIFAKHPILDALQGSESVLWKYWKKEERWVQFGQ